MASSWNKPKTRSQWGVFALGVLLLVTGLTLALGGIWLIILGGSWYYASAGVGLIAAAWFFMQRRMLGEWIYAGVFVFTLVWALWEVGLNGWALVPRLVGPLVLLFLVILSMPVLDEGSGGRRRALMGAGVWAALLVIGGIAIAQASRPATPEKMPQRLGAMHDPSLVRAGADWPAYGATYAAHRYSPLSQITRDNIGSLERAWVYRTGDLPEKKFGAETTPIKIGDTLYLCTARNIIIALDAGTGHQRWRYNPHISDDYIPYTAACRGVSYYAVPAANVADGCHERIIEGTLDGRLIAVNARTGQPCTGFGDNGHVRITESMGEIVPGMVSITSAPTIVRGTIVTGHQVLDGQRRDAPSGVVHAYDAITGEMRWAWDLAKPERIGVPPEGETYTLGTPNMWTTATGDEELGLVYLPLGNSAVDYWSGSRTPLENEYSASLVALDIATGRPRWHFQTVHMDVWDYDLGSQPTLVDFPTTDGPVPAIVLATKVGEIYVLDRRTGQPLHEVEERLVPGGGVEPKLRARTQPFSLFHTLRRPDLTERDMWGMSPIDQMFCRIQFRQATYKGIYTPPTVDSRWIQYPGYNGGSDWGGVAIDPQRGMIIANYNDLPNYNRLVPRAEADRLGWAPRGQARGGAMGEGAEGAGDPQAGTPYAVDVNAGWSMPVTNLLCKQPPYGGIRAIELTTGRTVWDRPLGTARRNGPFEMPSGIPFAIGTPNNGGAALTASGLIFIAAATDDLIRAIDIETGETVWQDTLPAGGQANPMVYEINGRQYVVIIAGGHHFMQTPVGDYVIAYALPN